MKKRRKAIELLNMAIVQRQSIWTDRSEQSVQTQIRLILKEQPGPEVIKLFSCSTQLSMRLHEILNAHKYKNIKKFGFFRLR